MDRDPLMRRRTLDRWWWLGLASVALLPLFVRQPKAVHRTDVGTDAAPEVRMLAGRREFASFLAGGALGQDTVE